MTPSIVKVHANVEPPHTIPMPVAWGKRFLPRSYTAAVFGLETRLFRVTPSGAVLDRAGDPTRADFGTKELIAELELYELDIVSREGGAPLCVAVRSETGLTNSALPKIKIDAIVRQATALISQSTPDFRLQEPITSDIYEDALASFEARHGTKQQRQGAITSADLTRVTEMAWEARRRGESDIKHIKDKWPCSRQHVYRLLNRADAAGYDVPPRQPRYRD